VAVLVLLALVAIAVWAGSLYLWPFGPCMRCGGSGRNSGSNSRRYGECRRCKGTGRRRRLGAKTIHRGAVSVADKARMRKGVK
jgi:hypothetical protein